MEKTDDNFIKVLKDENFWQGGESRHWIQDLTSPIKENDSILSGKHDIPTVYRSRNSRGGINDNIPCRSNTVQLQEKYRGGFDNTIKSHRPYILESFYYTDDDTERLLPYYGDFLLDSGAFTFMQNSKAHLNWEEYIERYADFINRNKIEKFFELDIDSVVGYDMVLAYRNKLNNLNRDICNITFNCKHHKQ